MSAAAAAALCVMVFIYIELAIGFGYYMYLRTTRNEVEKGQNKQIIRYSIIAGVFFPVTFAIIMAHKAAERS